MRNCSHRTIAAWQWNIDRFNRWCGERGIECVTQVTAELLAAYRRHLFHYRNPKTNRPLKFNTQRSYLMSVRRWFQWLAKQNIIPQDVSADLELPKEEKRLPLDALTAQEVERMINATDITTPLGLRDRAILETFHSTAIRCSELVALQVYDSGPLPSPRHCESPSSLWYIDLLETLGPTSCFVMPLSQRRDSNSDNHGFHVLFINATPTTTISAV